MATWLEITPDYRCNNRCVGCFSVKDDGPSMSTQEAFAALARARAGGAECLWLGGGEPTLRPDLLAIVRAARRLGYSRVLLQTNGMRLAYPAYTRALADAGVTEVGFSLKGWRKETHDRLTRTPGCHDLLLRGIAEARAAGLSLEGDVLVYRSNLAELCDVVRGYHGLGLSRFRLWLLSVAASGAEPRELAGEVPRISELVKEIVRARALGLSERRDFLTSLHTPPCTVPASHRACLFHAASFDLVVSNQGGDEFRLEQSPIEGGSYLERCQSCRLRAHCGGPRADYVALHGDAEFVPE